MNRHQPTSEATPDIKGSDSVSASESEFSFGSIQPLKSDPEDETWEPSSSSSSDDDMPEKRRDRTQGFFTPKKIVPEQLRNKTNHEEQYMHIFTKLKDAEDLITREFCNAGHTTLRGFQADAGHPLHSLWEAVGKRLREIYGYPKSHSQSSIKEKIASLSELISYKAREAAQSYRASRVGFNIDPDLYRNHLPPKADVLALRFVSKDWSFTTETMRHLAECNSLHLLQVLDGPSPATVPATSDNDTSTQRTVDYAPLSFESLQKVVQELLDRVRETEETCKRLHDDVPPPTRRAPSDEIEKWASGVNKKLDDLDQTCSKLSKNMVVVDSTMAAAKSLVDAVQGKVATHEQALEVHGVLVNGQTVAPRVAVPGPHNLWPGSIVQRESGFHGTISDNNSSPKRRDAGLEAEATPKRVRTQPAQSPSPFNVRH